MMKFGSMTISSIEYPNKISLVLFTGKCVFRCPYCHNPELVNGGEDVEIEKIILEIEKYKDFIDSVVISGGEPLCQPEEVKKILKHCKKLELNTKLDTNGYSSQNLEKIINLLDYIALDIKAPFDKYKEITKRDKGSEVKKSMEIALQHPNVYLECRTTYVPTLMDPFDIIDIAQQITCDKYTIQQFRNRVVLDKRLQNIANPSRNELKEIAELIPASLLNNICVKTAEFGNECIETDKEVMINSSLVNRGLHDSFASRNESIEFIDDKSIKAPEFANEPNRINLN